MTEQAKPTLKDAINGLPDIGAAKERAAIVAWLREGADYLKDLYDESAATLLEYAEAIEQGAHIE
jgi:hypothetical protein